MLSRQGGSQRELRPYAIIHSAFREVLFLDADNLPVRDWGTLSRRRDTAPSARSSGPTSGSSRKQLWAHLGA